MQNDLWAKKILDIVDPSFVPRWTVFKESLIRELDSTSIWIDVGCGNNALVRELKERCNVAVGVDIISPQNPENFISADIRALPFPDNYADVITLRFVVEHLESKNDLADVLRVLKPNGRLLFLTTNIWSPFVFFPRMLPNSLKHYLITKIFKVSDDDVFPTHHQLNTPASVRQSVAGFSFHSVQYISDLNTTRLLIFTVYLFWHIVTIPKFFNQFRANIFCIYKKN